MVHTKSIAELINSENSNFAKEQRDHEIRTKLLTALSSLKEPVTPSSVNAFGYASDASISFEKASLSSLLELFAPIPCTLATGGSFTVKPTAWLRESDPPNLTGCHPVTVVHRGKGVGEQYFRWWSTVAGLQVCIENKAGEPYNPGETLEMQTFEYATGWQCVWTPRKLAGKDVPVMGHLAVWNLAWDNFIAEHGYTGKVACQIKAYAKSLEQVKNSSLLNLPEFETPAEQIEFSELAKKQESNLKLVRISQEEEAKATLAWVQQFVKTHGKLNQVDRNTFEYLARKELGIDLKYSHSQYLKENALDICISIEGRFFRQTIEVEAQASNVNWQELAQFACKL